MLWHSDSRRALVNTPPAQLWVQCAAGWVFLPTNSLLPFVVKTRFLGLQTFSESLEGVHCLFRNTHTPHTCTHNTHTHAQHVLTQNTHVHTHILTVALTVLSSSSFTSLSPPSHIHSFIQTKALNCIYNFKVFADSTGPLGDHPPPGPHVE